MNQRVIALLLLAGCPESEDTGDDGPAAGTTTATTGDTDTVACDECDADPSCNSQVGVSGHCVCDVGHEWADPGDDEDFSCVPIPPRPNAAECGPDNHSVLVDGECYCEDGYNWCSADPADLSCCEDAAQGSDGTG